MDMWLFFSAIAIATAFLNVIRTIKGKEARHFMFFSLSFTALTLCAFYSANASRVINEDWSSLSDVAPVISRSLWICTIASVVINSVSFFRKPGK